MRNEDIHKDFDRSVVRDFLAQELEKAHRASGGAGVDWLEKEIKRYQDLLTEARRYEATIALIDSCGWTDWDVSDEVPFDKDSYFPFLGTEEEYEALMHKIEEENK